MRNNPKKANMNLNNEFANHIRRWWKKFTSGKRRTKDKKIIKEEYEL